MILRYRPSDCFETFPFPERLGVEPPISNAAGREYYEFRAALMVEEQRGPDEDLQPLPRSRRARPRHRAAPRAARRDGPRRPRRLRLDRHPADAASSSSTTRTTKTTNPGKPSKQAQAVALPLARRRPRRSARPVAGTERATREGRGVGRRRCECDRTRDTKKTQVEGERRYPATGLTCLEGDHSGLPVINVLGRSDRQQSPFAADGPLLESRN